jgi:hypothetical protein
VAIKIVAQVCFGLAGSAAILDAVASTRLFGWKRSEKDSSGGVQWPVRAFEATLGFGFLLGAILS